MQVKDKKFPTQLNGINYFPNVQENGIKKMIKTFPVVFFGKIFF